MENEGAGVSISNVDLYVPRKCSWTNRLLTAKDHASVQINVANVDPMTGLATGDSSAFCTCGYIRFKSEGDMALTELVRVHDEQWSSSSHNVTASPPTMAAVASSTPADDDGFMMAAEGGGEMGMM